MGKLKGARNPCGGLGGEWVRAHGLKSHSSRFEPSNPGLDPACQGNARRHPVHQGPFEKRRPELGPAKRCTHRGQSFEWQFRRCAVLARQASPDHIVQAGSHGRGAIPGATQKEGVGARATGQSPIEPRPKRARRARRNRLGGNRIRGGVEWRRRVWANRGERRTSGNLIHAAPCGWAMRLRRARTRLVLHQRANRRREELHPSGIGMAMGKDDG